ncbi:MAG: glutamate-1-semialdehyde 2,1-aminomutase [Actinomycetota bacterium]|nr:glutamate-1-semialdehyde 2,1-aminomutase [Actinomycetota bacterium]
MSRALYERAVRVIPGGVNSPVRAFTAVGGIPRFFVRGQGAHVWDEDGNRYVDLVQSWGPLVLGHAHPEVVAAAETALHQGSTFGAPTRGEVELAEELVAAVPSLEQVRLVSSGTEATMSVVRLARGVTGRKRILKFSGHYHGHSDALLTAAGSGAATLGIPGSPGVTDGAVRDTLLAPWNDLEAVDELVVEHGHDLAAIICEPIAANMGLVPATAGFLTALLERAHRVGALLIFDEVITGFRLDRAGAQGILDVVPDLTVLGKAIGGGFPLAAFGGRADVMEGLAPSGPVYQAGTLSGNPVAVAAGLAQLRLLDDLAFDHLRDVTGAMVAGLQTAFAEARLEAFVPHLGTLAGLFFGVDEVVDYEGARGADHDAYARFFHAMLARGVYLPPSGYEVLFPSLAHDEQAVERVVEAAGEAAAEVMEAGRGSGRGCRQRG